ncbi:ABC transporter permease [Flavihumibacter sp. ZG627]|uniref:ABC transporter permease n=1 Tax=Flavihumibacter sp. ZG627 TaxID=1463156 RepID=UPI00057F6212|nr:ABC transporter permease [Flavihumibacter sp. ZG627]KIC91288.1 hypothetical protein HY58_09870 [Flavihumibacter sp. ZG627]
MAFRESVPLLDSESIKVIHYNLSAALFSGIPISILVASSREFSTGFVSIQLLNGVQKTAFLLAKIRFSVLLSIIFTLLYIILLGSLHLFFGSRLDTVFYVKLTVLTFSVSLAINCMVSLLALIFTDWRISVMGYLGYSFLESLFVYSFSKSIPFLNLLPLNTLVTEFQFEQGLNKLPNRIAGWLILIFFIMLLYRLSIIRIRKYEL